MNLTQKASLNALAQALEYGSRLVVGFVINPLLVAGLGDYGYGAWQVLGRLIGYISPASGRATQVLKWTIANQQASTDYDAKRRQVGNALVVWLLFLPILSLLGAMLTWWTPTWLKAPPEAYGTIRWATALLVANLILLTLANVPEAVLKGENLAYRRMGWSAILVVVGGGLTAIALALNTGLVGVAIARMVTTVCIGLFFWQVAHQYVQWFGIARPERKSVLPFLKLSSLFLSWHLITKLMRASDVVVLGIADSAELVTSYTLAKYAPETLINIIAIFVFGITPGLGGIIGAGNLKKAAQVRQEIMVLTWLFITILGTTVLLWNRTFLGLWVGSAYDVGATPTLLILLSVTQYVLINNDASIIDLTLKLRTKVILGLLAAALSLGLAWWFVSPLQLGIPGLCLGFLLGRLIQSVGYPWLVGRFLGVSLWSQLRGGLRPTGALILLFTLGFYGGDRLGLTSWLTLALCVGLTLGLLSWLAFYLGLAQPQRQQVRQRLRQITPLHKSGLTRLHP